MGILEGAFLLVRALFVPRLALAIENLALRQQLAIVRQSHNPPNCFPATECSGLV